MVWTYLLFGKGDVTILFTVSFFFFLRVLCFPFFLNFIYIDYKLITMCDSFRWAAKVLSHTYTYHPQTLLHPGCQITLNIRVPCAVQEVLIGYLSKYVIIALVICSAWVSSSMTCFTSQKYYWRTSEVTSLYPKPHSFVQFPAQDNPCFSFIMSLSFLNHRSAEYIKGEPFHNKLCAIYTFFSFKKTSLFYSYLISGWNWAVTWFAELVPVI